MIVEPEYCDNMAMRKARESDSNEPTWDWPVMEACTPHDLK